MPSFIRVMFRWRSAVCYRAQRRRCAITPRHAHHHYVERYLFIELLLPRDYCPPSPPRPHAASVPMRRRCPLTIDAATPLMSPLPFLIPATSFQRRYRRLLDDIDDAPYYYIKTRCHRGPHTEMCVHVTIRERDSRDDYVSVTPHATTCSVRTAYQTCRRVHLFFHHAPAFSSYDARPAAISPPPQTAISRFT